MLHIPIFCELLDIPWPAAFLLESSALVSARFHPEKLSILDFSASQVFAPPNICAAAPKRQAEFLAGRICAQRALHRLSQQFATPSQSSDGLPCWPDGVTGSITHSSGLACAIVAHSSRFRGLGLDVEKRLNDEQGHELHAAILEPCELQCLTACHLGRSLGEAVALAFSLKESLFKALYPLVHTFFGFEDAEIIQCDALGRATLRLRRDLSVEWPQHSEFAAHYFHFEDFVGCLVAIEADQR